jgi:hypothetical protein
MWLWGLRAEPQVRLDWPESSTFWLLLKGLSEDTPRYRFYLIFYFDLESLKGVKSYKPLTVQISLSANALRGQQVLMFPEI